MKLGQTRKYKRTGSPTLWVYNSAGTVLQHQQQTGPPVTCQQRPETLAMPPGFNHNLNSRPGESNGGGHLFTAGRAPPLGGGLKKKQKSEKGAMCFLFNLHITSLVLP